MRKKILSVSGNDALRVTRHMMLESRGFDVVSTANLRETRNALKSANFDLVILGISIDGEVKREMTAIIRKACKRTQILELCRISPEVPEAEYHLLDRKSTRLNSSHVSISYAVFCLKKKKKSVI